MSLRLGHEMRSFIDCSDHYSAVKNKCQTYVLPFINALGIY